MSSDLPVKKSGGRNKMAQLMGIDESTVTAAQATAKKDRNFEARTNLLKLGYELPPGNVPTDATVGALYAKHRTMPVRTTTQRSDAPAPLLCFWLT